MARWRVGALWGEGGKKGRDGVVVAVPGRACCPFQLMPAHPAAPLALPGPPSASRRPCLVLPGASAAVDRAAPAAGEALCAGHKLRGQRAAPGAGRHAVPHQLYIMNVPHSSYCSAALHGCTCCVCQDALRIRLAALLESLLQGCGRQAAARLGAGAPQASPCTLHPPASCTCLPTQLCRCPPPLAAHPCLPCRGWRSF